MIPPCFFFSDKSEQYEFYHPLRQRVVDAKAIIQNHLAHVEKLVERCNSKYGPSAQQKQKAKNTEKNRKKESRKRPLETVEVD